MPASEPLAESLAARLAAAEARCDAAEERAASALALFGAVARLHDASCRADVLAAIAEVATACLGATAAAVYLREGAADRLAAAHIPGQPMARPSSPLLGAGLVGRAAAERRVLLGHWQPADRFDVAAPLGMEALLGAMVLLGVPLPDAAIGPDLRVRIEIVAHHAAIALARTTR